jgi:hypothetical protein
MDERGFQRWLDVYVDAWRTYDRAAIGRLFSEDVEYRYHDGKGRCREFTEVFLKCPDPAEPS